MHLVPAIMVKRSVVSEIQSCDLNFFFQKQPVHHATII